MEKYRCKDAYNGDIVYNGSSRHDLFYAMQNYDYECGSDWIPVLFENEQIVTYETIFDGSAIE